MTGPNISFYISREPVGALRNIESEIKDGNGAASGPIGDNEL
jgi:hypothetical protein